MSLTGTPLFNQLSVPARESMMGAFSLKAIGGVTAKVIQVSNGAAVKDFYADRTGRLLDVPVTGQTLRRWLGGATGQVTTWYDQSGRGNHMSCSHEDERPTVVLGDDGNNYIQSGPSYTPFDISANPTSGPVPYSNTKGFTVIWHHNTLGNNTDVCSCTDSVLAKTTRFGTFYGIYTSTFPDGSTASSVYRATGDTVTCTFDGTDRRMYTNGVLNSTLESTWTQSASTAHTIGSAGSNCRLYSVVMFDSVLSDADRTLVENVPALQTPSQVTNFVGSNQTETTIDLTWDASPLATGYIVICVNTGVPQTIEGATGATFIDLSHDTEYTFTIKPANMAGFGPTTTSAPIRTVKYANYIAYSGSVVDLTLPPGAYTFQMAGGSGPNGFNIYGDPMLGYWKRMTFKYTLTAATPVSFIVGGFSPTPYEAGGGGGSYIYGHGAINDWLFVVGGGGVNFNNSILSYSGGNLEMPEDAGDGAGGASNGPAGGGGAGVSAIGNGADGVSCGGGQGFIPDGFTVYGGAGGTGQYPGAFGGGGGGADIPDDPYGRKYVGGGGGYTGGSTNNNSDYDPLYGDLNKPYSTSGTSYKITGSELDSYTYGNGGNQNGYISINLV